MRVLVEVVENLTSSVRFIVGTLVLAGLAIGLMLTIGTSYAAPKVAEAIADRAADFGDKALKAAQEEARAKAMAGEGWGYGAPGQHEPDFSDEPKGDGWAQ